jgi:hypothetical protein
VLKVAKLAAAALMAAGVPVRTPSANALAAAAAVAASATLAVATVAALAAARAAAMAVAQLAGGAVGEIVRTAAAARGPFADVLLVVDAATLIGAMVNTTRALMASDETATERIFMMELLSR